jgi:pSer/pThr/pTyr-binding forkhead associated (FHA) protein
MRTLGVARIVIIHPNGERHARSLEAGSYIIGRTAADITLGGDRNVSRRHAQLEVTAAGLTITDLRSSFGTFHEDGMRLNAPTALHAGHSVLLGRTRLTVLSGPSPQVSGEIPQSTNETQPAIPAAFRARSGTPSAREGAVSGPPSVSEGAVSGPAPKRDWDLDPDD